MRAAYALAALVALAAVAACQPDDPRKPAQPAAPEGYVLTALEAPAAAPAPAPAPVAAPAEPPVKLVLLPSETSPLVAFRLIYRVGAADDPAGKEGLAALTARVVARGAAGELTYAQILDALYPMAASIAVHVDRHVTVVSGTVHRDHVAAFSTLLANQVLAPVFAEADFAREKRDALDAIVKELRSEDDEALGKAALEALMYEGRPYGRPVLGTAKGLEAVTLDDVKAFYASRLRLRDNLIVGLAGGYPEGFADAFAARFAVLDPAPVQRPEVPVSGPPEAPGLDVLLVEKATRAAALSLGHPLALTRADDDFYPLFLAASYLGEHRTFNGVLMNELRGKRGLNYGDYAYAEKFVQDGGSTFPRPNVYRPQQQFEIWIRPVAPANTLFSMRGALYFTERLVRDGIPQAAFEDTKAFLLAYSKLWTQSVSRRLGYAMDAELYGKDLVAELAARLPTMTKADVDAAVKRWIHPDRLAVAVVTPEPAVVAKALKAGAPTPIVYDTEGTPAEVLAVDAKIEAQPFQVRRVRTVPVGALFERPGVPEGQ